MVCFVPKRRCESLTTTEIGIFISLGIFIVSLVSTLVMFAYNTERNTEAYIEHYQKVADISKNCSEKTRKLIDKSLEDGKLTFPEFYDIRQQRDTDAKANIILEIQKRD